MMDMNFGFLKKVCLGLFKTPAVQLQLFVGLTRLVRKPSHESGIFQIRIQLWHSDDHSAHPSATRRITGRSLVNDALVWLFSLI